MTLSIPFSLFIEFTLSPSHERFAVVKRSLQREEYDPRKDFYLLLKNEMRRCALRNEPINSAAVLGRTEHPAKHDNYPVLIKNFEHWRSQKKREFIKPRTAIWRGGPLVINLKPDFAYEFKGEKYAAFMHCRKDLPVKKSASEYFLHIPAEAYDAAGIFGYRFCLVDLRAPRTWSLGNLRAETSNHLKREAESFMSIYRDLRSDEAA